MNAQYYRNKHMLGEMTFSDLLEFVRVEGDFSIGVNWLPITRVRKLKGEPFYGIFMYSGRRDPDAVIPVDSKVAIRGNIVEVFCDRVHPRCRRIRIRLEKEPAIL